MSYAQSTTWPLGKAPSRELCGEDQRLSVVASFDLDRLDGDEELARIARFAASLCETPTALISIVEAKRQRFLARMGYDEPETPRSTSICAQTMLGGEPLIIPDTTQDKRFADFALVVPKDGIRFYAGFPLISSEGAPLGALCVIDNKVRPDGLTAQQTDGLELLAQAVRRRLEAHRSTRKAAMELAERAAQLNFMLDSVPDIAWAADPGPQFTQFNARWHIVTGGTAPESVEDWRPYIHPDDYEASVVKFADAVENAKDFEDEWRLRQADGSYRWVLSRAVPSHADPANARWFGTLTDVDGQHQEAEKRELLSRELSHRIKNIFAVVSGLIAIRSRGRDEVRDFASELAETIQALSTAHDYVRPQNAPVADQLHALIHDLLAPYGNGSADRICVTGIDMPLRPEATTPIALVIHELATNAAKYGAFSDAAGRIELDVARVERDGTDFISITWREHSDRIAAQKGSENTGFGSTLLRMSINSQLGGSYEREFTDDGLLVTVLIPEDKLQSEQ